MKRISIIFAAGLLCACLLSSCVAPAAPAAQPAAPSVQPSAAPEPTPIPYQSVSAQTLYAFLQENDGKTLLIDLQPEKYYEKTGHLQNALATASYPANDESLLSKLEATLEEARQAERVVLIDMAGKAGAHNAFDYYANAGVDGEKLYILEGGMLAWPYDELVEITPEAYEVQSIAPKEVRKAFRGGKTQILLDLRSNEAYTQAHIKESVNVPSSSDAALVKALPLLAQDALSPIVLITEDGGEQVLAYYDYFARHAVLPSRLYVLEGGMAAWPEGYAHYLVKTEEPAGKSFEKVESTERPAVIEEAPIDPSQGETQYFG